MPKKFSQPHQKEMSEENAQSNSSTKGGKYDLGSLLLKNSSFKNPHRGEIEIKSRRNQPGSIARLKNFWENTGNADLKTSQESICVGPMGGEQYCHNSVFNQPKNGKKIRKSSDVTA